MIENRRAAAVEHEGGEALGRGDSEGAGANLTRRGHLDEPWDRLRARRDDCSRALAARAERRNPASQSPHRVKLGRELRLAVIILAAQMPGQGPIVSLFRNDPVAEQTVNGAHVVRGGVNGPQQKFGRHSLRGEKIDLGRKWAYGATGWSVPPRGRPFNLSA